MPEKVVGGAPRRGKKQGSGLGLYSKTGAGREQPKKEGKCRPKKKTNKTHGCALAGETRPFSEETGRKKLLPPVQKKGINRIVDAKLSQTHEGFVVSGCLKGKIEITDRQFTSVTPGSAYEGGK